MPKFCLDKLEALEKAATPGPWYNRKGYYYDGHENVELMINCRNSLPHMIAELRAAREVLEYLPMTSYSIKTLSNMRDELVKAMNKYDEVTSEAK